MPAWQKKRHDTDRDETASPQDAADIELQPGVGTAPRWVYLGPLIAIIVVVGIALLYWTTRDNTSDGRVEPTVGTSGDATPGGGDPGPKPDNTQEERDSRQDAR